MSLSKRVLRSIFLLFLIVENVNFLNKVQIKDNSIIKKVKKNDIKP